MCEQIHSNAGGDSPQVVRQAVIHRDLQPPGTPGVVRRDAGVRIGEIRGLHRLPVQVDPVSYTHLDVYKRQDDR